MAYFLKEFGILNFNKTFPLLNFHHIFQSKHLKIFKNCRNGTADCLRRSKNPERRSRHTLQGKDRKPGELLVQQNQCKIAFGPHYSICQVI